MFKENLIQMQSERWRHRKNRKAVFSIHVTRKLLSQSLRVCE